MVSLLTTPCISQLEPKEPLLPVMVYIHGGAYFSGSAAQYQPYALMTQDIVLVVLQYRLGTLGELTFMMHISSCCVS